LKNGTFLPDTEICIFIKEKKAYFNTKLPKDFYNKWWLTPRQKNDNHPTPKPPEIIRNHILLSSKLGDLILDPFVGSGTTAIEAKRCGRHYIGIDIKKSYCELAAKSLSQVTISNYAKIGIPTRNHQIKMVEVGA
jgi:site-specific DNA-methyltransferase (adenine-specific)